MSIEPTALANQTAAPSPGRGTGRGRLALVAGVLAAAAVTAAVNLLARPLPAESFDSLTAIQPVREAVWLFTLIGGTAYVVAFFTVGIAVCLLAPARGARFATAGAALTGLGGTLFGAGFMSVGVLDYYLTSGEVSSEASAAMFAYARDNAAHSFGIQAAGFGLSSLGVVLLAVALWRARSAPRWLAVAMPASLVVMVMIGGSGLLYDVLHAVYMATFVALAWCLWRSRVTAARIASSA